MKWVLSFHRLHSSNLLHFQSLKKKILQNINTLSVVIKYFLNFIIEPAFFQIFNSACWVILQAFFFFEVC